MANFFSNSRRDLAIEFCLIAENAKTDAWKNGLDELGFNSAEIADVESSFREIASLYAGLDCSNLSIDNREPFDPKTERKRQEENRIRQDRKMKRKKRGRKNKHKKKKDR